MKNNWRMRSCARNRTDDKNKIKIYKLCYKTVLICFTNNGI